MGRHGAADAAYALRATRRRQRPVEALARRLPRVGLDGVLGDLDRDAVPCDVPAEAAVEGFTWADRDRDDARWWPQGVATARGGALIFVAWYARRRALVSTPGARVSVVDRSDPARPRYRHVLLVVPRRRLGIRSLGPARVHAGGLALVGDRLLVADTLGGVRVFRLGDVLRVPGGYDAGRPWQPAALLGRRRGTARPRDYAYVLPQSARLRLPLRPGRGRLRFSFLSVTEDDGPPSLVVGEYGRAGTAPRLARYPLDRLTGSARARPVPPLEVHGQQPHRMQGVAVHGPTWYVSASAGEGRPGDLHVGRPGAFRRHRGVLPPGPEDLAWSRPGEELWCASEWPGSRWVFTVDARRWPGPEGTGVEPSARS